MRYESPREQLHKRKHEAHKRASEFYESKPYRKVDYGRQFVYRSETAAVKTIPSPEVPFQMSQIKELVNRIFTDERVIKIDPFPGEEVIVQNSCTNGANARPFERRLRFGTWKSNYAVYHEVAHILTPGVKHGNEFCRVMCMLIEWFENKQSADHMRMYLYV